MADILTWIGFKLHSERLVGSSANDSPRKYSACDENTMLAILAALNKFQITSNKNKCYS